MIRAFCWFVSMTLLTACSGDSSPSDPSDAGDSSNNNGNGSSSEQNVSALLINEVMSSNAIFDDEDGDSPDWIEIYNPADEAVSLHNWSLTDDDDEPQKWQFEDVTLEAKQYLIVWASDKNRQVSNSYRSLVSQGDVVRYVTPSQSLDSTWTSVVYDDNSWEQGPTGIGYGDGDDETTIASGTLSVFIRAKFSVSDVTNVESLLLDMDYDDAFIAYINGSEVARANISGVLPDPNTLATIDHEATLYSQGLTERFDISHFKDLLQSGENTLAIQAHNVSASSSDFSITPFLSAKYSTSTSDGAVPSDVLELPSSQLHTNFKISSSNSETIYLLDESGKVIDHLLIENVPANMSIGKNASGDRVYFDTPTQGKANSSQTFEGAVTSQVFFSHQGGLVTPMELRLSGNGVNEVIRYTTDSSIPTSSSTQYTSGIAIDDNSVVRAAIFKSGFIPSKTQTRSYITNAQHDFPVVMLVTEPDNMFDTHNGFYVDGTSASSAFPFFGANFWQDWEKPMHFSYYPSDTELGLAIDVGAKIFGGWSRANPQRSFSLFARGRYGEKEMSHPFFSDLDYQEFQAVVLRNSGQDWLSSMFKDVFLTGLMAGSGIDVQAAQPVVTYINGEYWGFYNLREKVNEHFLASKHNLDAEQLMIVEGNGAIVHGDNRDYNQLIDYVEANNLANDSAYRYVTDRLDIQNFIIYQIAQIYFDNHDWPGNNIKAWKSTEPQMDKWRWILYDTDFGFNTFPEWHQANSYDSLSFATSTNGPDWPNPPWSTLLLRKLLQNTEFKQAFISRFADELNSRFLADKVTDLLESHADLYRNEIPAHFDRWQDIAAQKGVKFRDWEQEVATMKQFAQVRPGFVKQHIANHFDLAGHHSLTVSNNVSEAGSVKINNNLIVSESQWSGDYFEGVPVALDAIPSAGYSFSHWLVDGQMQQNSLSLLLTADTHVEAIFIAQ